MKRWASLLVGFAVLAAMIWVAVFILRFAFSTITNLNPTVAASLIAASVTALASVGVVVIGKRIEAEAATRRARRERVAPVYEGLIKLMLEYFVKPDKGSPGPTKEETFKVLSECTRQMMVWGADDVITAWVKLPGLNLNARA